MRMTMDCNTKVGIVLFFFIIGTLATPTLRDSSLRLETDNWALKIRSGADPHVIAKRYGFREVAPLSPLLPDYYVLKQHIMQTSPPTLRQQGGKTVPISKPLLPRNVSRAIAARLAQDSDVMWSEQQIARWQFPRGYIVNITTYGAIAPADPLFPDQWHLRNTGQYGGTPGIDVDVWPVWNGFTNFTFPSDANNPTAAQMPSFPPHEPLPLPAIHGEGVVVAIVDDGLQHVHLDLASQYVAATSWDFTENDPDPSPLPYDSHGTACGGVAMATDDNGHCGVGAAFRGGLAGIRLIAGPTTDADEAAALTYHAVAGDGGVDTPVNDIYSCSWGPEDDAEHLEGPGTLLADALWAGVTRGRRGRGAVYVWAGGNGRLAGDNCNYDGYANSPLTVTVAAVDRGGRQAYYSEPCAALLVAAPSLGSDAVGITTVAMATPSNPSPCRSDFGGTSAAAPLVAGVVAMVIQANPMLTWLDVQRILAATARVVDEEDTDWTVNGAGYRVNHKYGFGLIDAAAAVAMATQYTPTAENEYGYVGPFVVDVDKTMPKSGNSPATLTSTYFLDLPVDDYRALKDDGITHVVVNVDIDHGRRGDLRIVLTSPAGTASVLAEPHGFTAVAAAEMIVVATTSPSNATTQLSPVAASFGPIVADVTAEGAVPDPITGCVGSDGSLNGVAGKVAVVMRGNCTFIDKIMAAQRGDAVGVIVVDNVGEAPFAMSGDGSDVVIPAVMVSYSQGAGVIQAVQSQTSTAFLRIVLTQQKTSESGSGYKNWAFSTTRCWGESPAGVWTLTVTDIDGTESKNSPGVFKSWSLSFLSRGVKRPIISHTGNPKEKEEPGEDVTVHIIIALVIVVVLIAVGFVAMVVLFRRVKCCQRPSGGAFTSLNTEGSHYALADDEDEEGEAGRHDGVALEMGVSGRSKEGARRLASSLEKSEDVVDEKAMAQLTAKSLASMPASVLPGAAELAGEDEEKEQTYEDVKL